MLTRLFRFELAFDGEFQGVGLFQGLDDIGLPVSIKSKLYALFNDLPVTDLYHLEESVEFWFTEYGLGRFADALDEVVRKIATVNWQLLGAMAYVETKNVVYADKMQVAFLRSDSPFFNTGDSEYINVTDIKSFLATISPKAKKHST